MENNLKPGFGSSFRHGWQTMMKYFLILLLVVMILGVVSSPMGIGDGNASFRIENTEDFHWDGWESLEDLEIITTPSSIAAAGIMALLGFIAMAYMLLVVPVFSYGAKLMFLKAARDTRPEFEDLVQGFKKNYLYIVLSNLLTTALIMLGLFFLIIPGIIVACRLVFVPYLVIEKGMDPIIAVEQSWKMSRGHGWKIFGMAIASFFIFILGLALLIVGIIPAIIWVKSAFASLYEAVSRQRELEPAVA